MCASFMAVLPIVVETIYSELQNLIISTRKSPRHLPIRNVAEISVVIVSSSEPCCLKRVFQS